MIVLQQPRSPGEQPPAPQSADRHQQEETDRRDQGKRLHRRLRGVQDLRAAQERQDGGGRRRSDLRERLRRESFSEPSRRRRARSGTSRRNRSSASSSRTPRSTRCRGAANASTYRRTTLKNYVMNIKDVDRTLTAQRAKLPRRPRDERRDDGATRSARSGRTWSKSRAKMAEMASAADRERAHPARPRRARQRLPGAAPPATARGSRRATAGQNAAPADASRCARAEPRSASADEASTAIATTRRALESQREIRGLVPQADRPVPRRDPQEVLDPVRLHHLRAHRVSHRDTAGAVGDEHGDRLEHSRLSRVLRLSDRRREARRQADT